MLPAAAFRIQKMVCNGCRFLGLPPSEDGVRVLVFGAVIEVRD